MGPWSESVCLTTMYAASSTVGLLGSNVHAHRTEDPVAKSPFPVGRWTWKKKVPSILKNDLAWLEVSDQISRRLLSWFWTKEIRNLKWCPLFFLIKFKFDKENRNLVCGGWFCLRPDPHVLWDIQLLDEDSILPTGSQASMAAASWISVWCFCL